ncbi:MAG TPA: ECF-type sigma factor [Tepidisphaeraceae bacterium]|nr:ECF-type sigma factor [Tepidisphaeraceae bacterium]
MAISLNHQFDNNGLNHKATFPGLICQDFYGFVMHSILWQDGEMAEQRNDAAELLPQVYEELRILAQYRMAQENVEHTLQATALVHEAYMRLAGPQGFANRAHFFKAAANAMRNILVEHARSKARLKRGGRESRRVPLNVLDLAHLPDSEQILALEDAVERLEQETPIAASVVRLRFYAGLSVDETAEALGISPRSVNREWTYARAWLFRLLDDGSEL